MYGFQREQDDGSERAARATGRAGDRRARRARRRRPRPRPGSPTAAARPRARTRRSRPARRHAPPRAAAPSSDAEARARRPRGARRSVPRPRAGGRAPTRRKLVWSDGREPVVVAEQHAFEDRAPFSRETGCRGAARASAGAGRRPRRARRVGRRRATRRRAGRRGYPAGGGSVRSSKPFVGPRGRRTTASSARRGRPAAARVRAAARAAPARTSGRPSKRRTRPGSRWPNSPTRGSPVTSTSARAERSTSALERAAVERIEPDARPTTNPRPRPPARRTRAAQDAARRVRSRSRLSQAAPPSPPRPGRARFAQASPVASAAATTCAGRTRVMARRGGLKVGEARRTDPGDRVEAVDAR